MGDLSTWLAELGKEEEARQRPSVCFSDLRVSSCLAFSHHLTPEVSGENRSEVEDGQHSFSVNTHSKSKGATDIQLLQGGVSGSLREIGVEIMPIGLGL